MNEYIIIGWFERVFCPNWTTVEVLKGCDITKIYVIYGQPVGPPIPRGANIYKIEYSKPRNEYRLNTDECKLLDGSDDMYIIALNKVAKYNKKID